MQQFYCLRLFVRFPCQTWLISAEQKLWLFHGVKAEHCPVAVCNDMHVRRIHIAISLCPRHALLSEA